jgi:hypothetical protein
VGQSLSRRGSDPAYWGVLSWFSLSPCSGSRAVGNPFRAKFPPCISGAVVETGIS